MSRYNLEVTENGNRHKQGILILLLIVALFTIAYQYEAGKLRSSQTVVSKDYEVCLQTICLSRGNKDYEECLSLEAPTMCNVRVVNVNPLLRYAKRLEIDPLSARCGDY